MTTDSIILRVATPKTLAAIIVDGEESSLDGSTALAMEAWKVLAANVGDRESVDMVLSERGRRP